MFWVAIPLVAAYVLFSAATSIVPAVRASQGEGVAGTFTALRQECSGRHCAWYGRFDSVDGKVHFDDVIVDGGVSRVGNTEAALYEGERNTPKVYRARNSHDWIYVTLMGFAAITYLCFWLQALRRRRQGLGNWIDV